MADLTRSPDVFEKSENANTSINIDALEDVAVAITDRLGELTGIALSKSHADQIATDAIASYRATADVTRSPDAFEKPENANTSIDIDALEVTQADREAAYDCLEDASVLYRLEVSEGRKDGDALVQAFARHRQQSIASYRAQLAAGGEGEWYVSGREPGPASVLHTKRSGVLASCDTMADAKMIRDALNATPTTAAAKDDEIERLPLMQAAFRTTVSEGGDKPSYEMRFKFRSMEEMHAADDEWRAFRKATS